MIQLIPKCNYHKLDGTVEVSYITHIYSLSGFFTDLGGHKCGWHISLGTNDTAENYSENACMEQHSVPEHLPDIDEYEEDEPPTDEEYIEAAKIMLGEET